MENCLILLAMKMILEDKYNQYHSTVKSYCIENKNSSSHTVDILTSTLNNLNNICYIDIKNHQSIKSYCKEHIFHLRFLTLDLHHRYRKLFNLYNFNIPMDIIL